MKKILTALLLIAGLLAIVLVTPRFFGEKSDPSPTRIPAAYGAADKAAKLFDINLENEKYSVVLISVEDNQALSLIANFEEKLTSDEIASKYNCRAVVNGGFYLENSKPAGFFISNNRELKGWSENKLFNGVLSVNDFEVARITAGKPRDNLRWGFQTGPIIRENGKSVKLFLGNDKNARRIVAAVDGENKLSFLVFYNPDQIFDGPRLQDLPKGLEILEQQADTEFADAVNLDGGTASAFIAGSVKLTELTPIGSALCF